MFNRNGTTYVATRRLSWA